MSDDFLSRWSRKKQLDHQIVSRGRPMEAEAPDAEQAGPSETESGLPQAGALAQRPAEVVGEGRPPEDASNTASGPVIDEARSLPVGADVRRFMQPDVSEDVRREALQKLFADPMYNVISDMDDYVEDYSNLPNLSRAELKTLNHIKGLFLFEDPPWKIEAEAREREEALNPVAPQEVPEEDSPANTVTVSPPPPHIGRLRPPTEASEGPGELDQAALPDGLQADVPLSGRRYQPTKRQDHP
jgi:hypothetical protein